MGTTIVNLSPSGRTRTYPIAGSSYVPSTSAYPAAGYDAPGPYGIPGSYPYSSYTPSSVSYQQAGMPMGFETGVASSPATVINVPSVEPMGMGMGGGVPFAGSGASSAYGGQFGTYGSPGYGPRYASGIAGDAYSGYGDFGGYGGAYGAVPPAPYGLAGSGMGMMTQPFVAGMGVGQAMGMPTSMGMGMNQYYPQQPPTVVITQRSRSGRRCRSRHWHRHSRRYSY